MTQGEIENMNNLITDKMMDSVKKLWPQVDSNKNFFQNIQGRHSSNLTQPLPENVKLRNTAMIYPNWTDDWVFVFEKAILLEWWYSLLSKHGDILEWKKMLLITILGWQVLTAVVPSKSGCNVPLNLTHKHRCKNPNEN